MRRTVEVLALACLAASVSRAAQDENLYEWMAVAPIVATVTIAAEDARFTEVRVEDVLRGSLESATSLLVDLRTANRDRRAGSERLDLTLGAAYLILLEPVTPRKPLPLPLYAIVRGTSGARRLPEEGREAVVSAARRLAGIQEIPDDRLVWGALGDLLFDDRPLLIRSSLELHLKFHRGTEALLPRLEPLLDHPTPEIRAGACSLVGQVVARGASDPASMASPDLLRILIARARGDEAVPVRIAATRAVAAFRTATSQEALRAIADDDPVQDVRYEAERLLHEASRTSD